MDRLQRIELINKIYQKMFQLFDEQDAHHYFEQLKEPYGLNEFSYFYGSEHQLDIKSTLQKLSNIALQEIAEEFKIDVSFQIITPPKKWQRKNSIKVFIGHPVKLKKEATRLSNCLAEYNISGFVAHEDIHPTSEWIREIHKALNVMDLFISLHTTEFTTSIYCQQEVGYALAKGTKIIPIKFTDEPPSGFISNIQALARGTKKAEELTDEILTILKEDSKMKFLYESYILPTIKLDDEVPF